MSVFSSDPHREQPKWRRYLRFYRPDPAADLDDELRDHLESSTEALVASGMSPADARASALRRFGDVASVRDEVATVDARELRRTRGAEVIETLVQDIRFAWRGFLRSPGFVVVAALSIAIGAGANTTIFSVVNAVLLRPIPGATNDRLVRVYVNDHSPFSWQDLSWFRDRAGSFDAIAGERYGAMGFRAGANDRVERVRTSLVTDGYWAMLGVPFAVGRPFSGDERTSDAARPVAVLSHDFWRSRFGGDSGVVGRTVTVGGHPVQIVGVASADFKSAFVGRAPELFLPLAAAVTITGTTLDGFGGSLYTTARLKPGISRAQASAELGVLMSQLARTDSARYERTTVRLGDTRGIEAELRSAAMAGSSFLMVMVGIVLLIACANVANLLLGRASARRTEIGVRLALGASRARIVRQLLTESLMIASLGSALGFLVALVLTRVIADALPAEAGLGRAVFTPDWRVLLFTGLLCLAATVMSGLVPALRATTPQLVTMIKGDDAGAGGASVGRRRRRGGLVMAQVALCVLMLAVAGLFGRSLQRISGVDTGFVAEGVVDVPIDLSLVGSDSAMHRATFERILTSARTLPGVTSATLSAFAPLSGSNMETRVQPEGTTASSRFDLPAVYFNVITPGYFETLRIPIRRGRGLADGDAADAGRVIIVNEMAAEQWWPGQDAIGKRVRWGGVDGREMTVVGVARDADYNMPGETQKTFAYVPFTAQGRSDMTLHLRTTRDIASTRDAVWSMLRAEVPTLPPPPVTTMTQDSAMTLLPVRVGAILLAALGGIALLLAASGIYGVTSFAVARRTREIGIRAALGAVPSRLVRLVVRDSLRPVRTGLLIGLTLAVAAAVGLSRLLYGVEAVDPVVLAGVSLVLLMVATIASLLPAWRAASVNPVTAMRSG
ncbi:MAG: ABC transporter permease [Gemmatimonadota bacterium]